MAVGPLRAEAQSKYTQSSAPRPVRCGLRVRDGRVGCVVRWGGGQKHDHASESQWVLCCCTQVNRYCQQDWAGQAVQVSACCIPAQVNGDCSPAHVNGSCIPAQVNGCCIPAHVNGSCILGCVIDGTAPPELHRNAVPRDGRCERRTTLPAGLHPSAPQSPPPVGSPQIEFRSCQWAAQWTPLQWGRRRQSCPRSAVLTAPSSQHRPYSAVLKAPSSQRRPHSAILTALSSQRNGHLSSGDGGASAVLAAPSSKRRPCSEGTCHGKSPPTPPPQPPKTHTRHTHVFV